MAIYMQDTTMVIPMVNMFHKIKKVVCSTYSSVLQLQGGHYGHLHEGHHDGPPHGEYVQQHQEGTLLYTFQSQSVQFLRNEPVDSVLSTIVSDFFFGVRITFEGTHNAQYIMKWASPISLQSSRRNCRERTTPPQRIILRFICGLKVVNKSIHLVGWC